MLYTSDVIPISDLDCVLHFPNGGTEDFVIEAPNGIGMFNFTIREVQTALYRDANRVRRKGFREKEIVLQFNYSSHYMALHKPLIADYIEINFGNFPLPFSNTDFILDSNSVEKNWLSNYVIAQSGSELKESNPIPSGQATLNFLSVKESTI